MPTQFYGPPELQGPPELVKSPWQGPPRPNTVVGPFKPGSQPSSYGSSFYSKARPNMAGVLGVPLGVLTGGAELSLAASGATKGPFGKNVYETTHDNPLAGAMSGDYGLGAEIIHGIKNRANPDAIANAEKIAEEKRKSDYSHSPQTQASLRNMDTEKLVKILAARPNLISQDEWQSSPEMYQLYQKTRRQLGLPTNAGSIKTNVKPPEPRESMRDFRDRPYEENYPGNKPIVYTPSEDVSFGPKALTPRAELPRVDESAPVATIKSQEEERNMALRGMILEAKRDLTQKYNVNYDVIPRAVEEKGYSVEQMQIRDANREKAKQALELLNNPKVEEILMKDPLLLKEIKDDPIRAFENNFEKLASMAKGIEPKEPKEPEESGVAAVTNIAPNPLQSSVGGGNEEGYTPQFTTPNSTASSVGGGNEYGRGNTEIPKETPSAAGELQSLQQLAKKYPTPSVQPRSLESTPSKPTTYTMDPLTRKAYAPVTPDYRSDQAIQRSGEGGTESALDFIQNTPIYKKRMEEAPAEARGGMISKGGNPHDSKCHVGIIHMAVGGRTDHLPMNVYANSYVLPADVVSGLGEGNTLAGGKVIDHMFSGDSLRKLVNKSIKSPLHRDSGGQTKPKTEMQTITLTPTPTLDLPNLNFEGGPMGAKIIPLRGGPTNFGPHPYEYRWSPDSSSKVNAARGGMINDRSLKPIEIIAAGGEYVIPPEVVRALGHGDADAGHKWLDNFVKSTRAHTIKTMQKLPGPKKD